MFKARKGMSFAFVVLLLVVIPLSAAAQDELIVSVSTSVSCDQVDFSIEVEGGSAPYTLLLDFGDEESYQAVDIEGSTIQTSHVYPSHGEWEWTVALQDGDGLIGESEGVITLAGPGVTLSSVPFPPLLTLESGQASAQFTAEVSGGTAPYTYTWDLDGDGAPDAGLEGDTASQTYAEAGKFEAAVAVTDGCGFTAIDTLTVIVVDPEDEDACHPTAQKIAEAVSSIFPDRAERTYTCTDIFDIFRGEVFGYQVGFGRMWHAYQLTQTIDELTWEEIRDWHLNYSGWGALTQLDRFAAILETHGVRDLMDLVISGEQSIGDIRTAVRSVLRHEADFEDVLQRINDGANSGELNQFFSLVSKLEVDPTILDGYMADGMTLSELRHAARFADRFGEEFSQIVEAKAFDHAWGEIGQAYRLAGEDVSAADILAVGVKQYQALQREVTRTEREEERAAREEEQSQRTAEKIAEQFELESVDELLAMLAECEGSWGCVRKALREQKSANAAPGRTERLAAQIASQYGYPEAEVMNTYETACALDWNCVRAHYRELAKDDRGKGKDK